MNERPETITTEEEKEKPDGAFKGHERLLMKKSIKRIADAREVSMELLSHSIPKTERVYKKTARGSCLFACCMMGPFGALLPL